jgi:hypothetical protein
MYRLAVGMTNGQIDRLGERLRSSPVVEPADLELLQELRRDYDDAMREAQSRIVEALPEIGTPTARLKTVQTLIGKLRREPNMNLSQMQDIAGLRLVRDLSLRGQTALATSVAELFDNPRTVDRRAKPTFGYRAVHVVVRVSGRLVEVQLRTVLQDQWAQIVERMADHWGRQIRYGLEPDSPQVRIGETDRSFVVDLVRRLSPLIESSELSGEARQLKVSGDFFRQEVTHVLGELAALPVLGSAA